MKILQLEFIRNFMGNSVKSLVTVACLVLLSHTAHSNAFVFPEHVSLVENTLAQSFTDSEFIKSVGLRDESSLAGFVKTSILAPQPGLKGSVASALVLSRVAADGKHARYNQLFQGNRVFGGQVIAHLDKQGDRLDRVTGNFITGLEQAAIATKPEFNHDRALVLAKQQMDDSHQWSFENSQVDLLVYHNPDREGFKPALAYIVNFLATSDSAEPTRPFMVIDARSGDILDRWEGLNT